MKHLVKWIAAHQVIAFFILTFAITWGLGFSYSEVMHKGNYLLAPLVMIATCGPAFAGIIVTAISNPGPRQGSRKVFWLAFLIAWVVCGLVFNANNKFINHASLSPILVVITFTMVIPVALVISLAWSRRPAMKRYLSSLFRLRGVWGWALLALVLPLLLIILSSLIGGNQKSVMRIFDISWALAGLVLVKFIYQFFFFNATGEEAGWRGFALPRLQTRMSPLLAGLLLGLFWPPWHFLLWQAEGQPVMNIQFWLQSYASHIPAALLFVWFYNRSKGSILVAGIIHAAANTTSAIVPDLRWQIFDGVMLGFVGMVFLIDRMWRKLPADHPAVFQPPTPSEEVVIPN